MAREHILQFMKKKLEREFTPMDMIKRYLPMKALISLIKNFLMMYEGDEVQIFFVNEFFNYTDEHEYIQASEFLVMMVEIYQKMLNTGLNPVPRKVKIPRKKAKNFNKGKFYPDGNPFDHHSFACLGAVHNNSHGHLQDRKKKKDVVDWFLWSDYTKLESPLKNSKKRNNGSRKKNYQSSSGKKEVKKLQPSMSLREIDNYWKRNFSPFKKLYKKDDDDLMSSNKAPRLRDFRNSNKGNTKKKSFGKSRIEAENEEYQGPSLLQPHLVGTPEGMRISKKKSDIMKLSSKILDNIKNGDINSPLYTLVEKKELGPIIEIDENSSNISRDLMSSLNDSEVKDKFDLIRPEKYPYNSRANFNKKRISKLLKVESSQNQIELFSIFDKMKTVDEIPNRKSEIEEELNYRSRNFGSIGTSSGNKSKQRENENLKTTPLSDLIRTNRTFNTMDYKKILEKVNIDSDPNYISPTTLRIGISIIINF